MEISEFPILNFKVYGIHEKIQLYKLGFIMDQYG